ncbi:MAG: HAD-IIB family hydrolase [Fusobacteria bacterium]|nr:HAD-IIB family hydrolase [Fusobacteriota bacterium]
MSTIKNILMDIDGTIFTIDRKFPENLSELIKIHPEINWLITSGRSLDLVRILPFASLVSQSLPHVLDGGSKLEYINGTIYDSVFLTTEELDTLFNQLSEDIVEFIYSASSLDNRILFAEKPEKFNFNQEFASVKITNNFDEFQAWCYQIPPSKIFVHSTYKLDLKNLHFFQNECHFDVTHMGVDKGSGAKKLFTKFSLKPEETIMLFNDFNDLPLVESPFFHKSLKIKVGELLPNTPSDFTANTPYDVADILKSLILES